MKRLIMAGWMLEGGVARTARLKAEFRANAAGYEAGRGVLADPPCFAQLAVDADPVAPTAQAEAMGLEWLEYHQGMRAPGAQ